MQRKFFPLVAAGLLSLASACATLGAGVSSRSLARGPRLLDTKADFISLGLDPKIIRPWEDGRRSPSDPRHYEWWYLDAILDDGTVVVAWFGDNWPFGTRLRTVSLEVTEPGKEKRFWTGSYAEPGLFSTENCDIRIGPHRFSGNLDDYEIFIDPGVAGGLGLDVLLHRQVVSWRPSSGIVADGEDYFAWLAAVPDGELTGRLVVDGRARRVAGSGYHDHNWGNRSPAELMTGWWWGRAKMGDRTVIAAELIAAANHGGERAPLLFIGTPRGIEKEAWSAERLEVSLGSSEPHPDPRHRRPIASWIRYETDDGFVVTFPLSGRLIASEDLLGPRYTPSSFVGGAARALGFSPWYTRYLSRPELRMPGEAAIEGEGTIEYFEFR